MYHFGAQKVLKFEAFQILFIYLFIFAGIGV
jgi:hypothetical protein